MNVPSGDRAYWVVGTCTIESSSRRLSGSKREVASTGEPWEEVRLGSSGIERQKQAGTPLSARPGERTPGEDSSAAPAASESQRLGRLDREWVASSTRWSGCRC